MDSCTVSHAPIFVARRSRRAPWTGAPAKISDRASSASRTLSFRTAILPSWSQAEWSAVRNFSWTLSTATRCPVMTPDAVILYTLYFILYTLYSILYTLYYILYTIYFILYTIYYIYGGLQRISVHLTERVYLKVYHRESRLYGQHCKYTMACMDLRKHMMYNLVKQLNPIEAMKSFTKPN